MQPLPKGVTGFDAPDDGVPVEGFTASCHTAARQVTGRVHQVKGAYEQVIPNFHEAFMTLRDRPEMIRVLCNAHYPIAAFATPPAYEGDARLEFVDCPELAEALRGEFSIITRRDACAGVTDALIAQLGDDELEQLRYWRPQRIGDLIFNYWD